MMCNTCRDLQHWKTTEKCKVYHYEKVQPPCECVTVASAPVGTKTANNMPAGMPNKDRARRKVL